MGADASKQDGQTINEHIDLFARADGDPEIVRQAIIDQ